MSNTNTTSPWQNRIVGHGEEPPDQLLANPRNWRLHSSEQQAALNGVLENVGLVQSIVVNRRSGFVVDGHLRIALALRSGQEAVPVTYVDLSAEEERVVLASLDPIAAMAVTDKEKFGELLSSVENEDLASLLVAVAAREKIPFDVGGTDGGTAEDMPAAIPEEPISKSGDLWLLGRHRLLCGDSTKPADVERLMAGERASLMATDPPYLVDYDGGNHPQTWSGTRGRISCEEKTRHWDAYTDHVSAVDFYRDFLAAALAHALSERPIIYQWFGMMKVDIVLESWRAAGLLPHQVLIWKKTRRVLTRCDYMWDYEPFVYGWVRGERPESVARPPANATAVWEVESGIEDDPGLIHPTMKPVELIRRPIHYHTKPGELIYEPFSGSGTAIIAAESTGRRCYAMEQSPAFVDAAVARWEAFTGEHATRATH